MTYTTAANAFALAKRRDFATLRQSKISENFTWGEFFTNRTDAQIFACPRLAYNEGVKTAVELQKLRKITGPLNIESWYRPNSGNHATGSAVDFRGTEQVLYRIWNAAIDLKWKGGMGVSKPNHDPRLHLDRLASRTWWYEHGNAANSAPGKVKLLLQ